MVAIVCTLYVFMDNMSKHECRNMNLQTTAITTRIEKE